MFAVATLFIFGRFASRLPAFGGRGYSWDDYLAFFSYAILVPTDVTAELEVQNGLGLDIYMLDVDNIVNILFVSTHLYPHPRYRPLTLT